MDPDPQPVTDTRPGPRNGLVIEIAEEAGDWSGFDAGGRQIGVVFATSSPFDTPDEMEALFAWHRRVEDGELLHPLLRIAYGRVVSAVVGDFANDNR